MAGLAASILNGSKAQSALCPHFIVVSEKRAGKERTDGVETIFEFPTQSGLQGQVAFA
jgi:hypothetical protein